MLAVLHAWQCERLLLPGAAKEAVLPHGHFWTPGIALSHNGYGGTTQWPRTYGPDPERTFRFFFRVKIGPRPERMWETLWGTSVFAIPKDRFANPHTPS